MPLEHPTLARSFPLGVDDSQGQTLTEARAIQTRVLMAEQSVHDVVEQARSVGDLSPSDAPATTTNTSVIGDEGDVGLQKEEVDFDDHNGSQSLADDKVASSFERHAAENAAFDVCSCQRTPDGHC